MVTEPIIRCGQCDKPIDTKEGWCWNCGSMLSTEDLRQCYERIEDEPQSSNSSGN